MCLATDKSVSVESCKHSLKHRALADLRPASCSPATRWKTSGCCWLLLLTVLPVNERCVPDGNRLGYAPKRSNNAQNAESEGTHLVNWGS